MTRLQENQRRWYKRHRQVEIERNTRWAKTHPANTLCARVKKRAKENNLEFTLTSEYCKKLMEPMLCSMTGLPLIITNEARHPFQPSLDRKDPLKGYTQENTRVVCWAYNTAKATWDDETVLLMARALIKETARGI